MNAITQTINEALLRNNAVGVSAAQISAPVFNQLLNAVNASCACGGKPMGDGCCPACEVWHRLAK